MAELLSRLARFSGAWRGGLIRNSDGREFPFADRNDSQQSLFNISFASLRNVSYHLSVHSETSSWWESAGFDLNV
jgi:hypothetical protein